MKLGHAMGEMQKPSKYGVEKEFGCTLDDDCADTEKCINGICTNPCLSHPCPSGEFCLNEGNHSFTCVECTSNEQCEDREICKNNSCIDACYGDPCASKKQSCSSQSGHTYICYGCSSDEACDDTEACDITEKQCKPLCPDACPHQLCSIETPHRATCSGCTDDEGCAEGEICDLTEGSETINQCIVQSCESMVLAQRDDVAVAIDAATLSEALASSKPVIFIANDITYDPKISLENRKMVGANFFTDIPLCKMAEAPVLRTKDDLYLSDGEISDLKIISGLYVFATVRGYGTLNNIDINSKSRGIYMHDGDLLLKGNNVIASDDPSITTKDYARTTLTIADSLTLKENNVCRSFGIILGDFTNIHTLPNSKISLEGCFQTGISADYNSRFDADGIIVMNEKPFLYGVIANIESTVSLNGNGNIIYGDFRTSLDSKVTINGETKIRSGNFVQPIGSSGGILTISAPVGVDTGDLFDMHYGTVIIDSTVNHLTKKFGFLDGNGLTLPSVSQKAGPNKLTKNASIRGIKGFSFGSGGFDFEKGAELEFNGVCKKASKDGSTGSTGTNFPAGFDLPCD